ncbi:MAG TPA: glycosyltransferase family 1 protein [Acidimicrobiales bacterium]|nr:glycosyltransferase family 1 protein [Acidimicrobiales bacterium]
MAAEPLRVGVDVTAVPARPAGAGVYTLELVRALARREDTALRLLARRGDGPRWAACAPAAEVAATAPAARPARLVWGELCLAAAATRGRSPASVLHCPHYTMPARPTVPVAVTVHDLTLVERPAWHERSKVLVFRRALKVAAARAEAIIVPSRHTAERLVAAYDVAGAVRVIPHGVDHARFTPTEPAPGADRAALAALGLSRPYVVHLGTIEPRKDLATLVAAFDCLAGRRGDLELVLAGAPGWGRRVLAAALRSARHRDRVRQLGYVPPAAVPALLRQAAAVAYPSLEEGFGLPALEALACGAPLVTTEGTAMAELAGEAAVLVPKADPGALADALELATARDAAAERRRRAGLRKAAEHTWEACAAAHVEVFAELARGTRRRPAGSAGG